MSVDICVQAADVLDCFLTETVLQYTVNLLGGALGILAPRLVSFFQAFELVEVE